MLLVLQLLLCCCDVGVVIAMLSLVLLLLHCFVLSGLHTANLSWQTLVGKLKLKQKQSANTVANRTCLYSPQLFH